MKKQSLYIKGLIYQPYGANKEKIEVLSNEDDDDDLPPFLRRRGF